MGRDLYNITRRVKKFDTDEPNDIEEYEDILNNPLCSIVESHREKLKTKEFDLDGNLLSETEQFIMVVTWEVRSLA